MQCQQLLRERFFEFLRRDAELIDRQFQFIDVEARRARFGRQRPAVRLRMRFARFAVEQVFLKRAGIAPRTDVCPHTHHRDRFCRVCVLRRHALIPPVDGNEFRRRCSRGIVPGPLFNEQVRVDPAKTESTHRSAPRKSRLLAPLLRLAQHLEWAVRVAQARGWLREVRLRWELFGPHCEQHLRERRSACAGEQVPHRGFHRADHGLPGCPPALAPQLAQAVEFDRVADRRTRRVALDQLHVRRVPTGPRVSRAHRAELPFLCRREQVPVHVVRQPDTRDHTVNRVAVGERIRKALQHENAGPLAHHEPVRARIEGRAPPAHRERPELREAHLRVLAVRARAPARQHRVRAPREQFIGRELDRVQRRSARRVEREAPTAQPQPIREHPRWQPRNEAVQRVRRRARR